jgi:hypothetical protein
MAIVSDGTTVESLWQLGSSKLWRGILSFINGVENESFNVWLGSSNFGEVILSFINGGLDECLRQLSGPQM